MPAPKPGVEWESTYDPGMAPRAMELMAQGKTRIEVAAALGIHRNTLRYWASDPKDHRYKKDFAIAMSKGTDQGYCWWIEKGRTNLENREFNTPLFGLLMANMNNWRSGGASKDDEAMEEIRKLKEQLGMDAET